MMNDKVFKNEEYTVRFMEDGKVKVTDKHGISYMGRYENGYAVSKNELDMKKLAKAKKSLNF